MASGVNNAVARVAQLAAVAILPLLAGRSGPTYHVLGERPVDRHADEAREVLAERLAA